MSQNKNIKAENYGEMFAQIHDMQLVSFETDGGYQGDYLVVLKDEEKKKLYYYIGSYGSCSGCDWLEAEKDYSTGEIDYKKALDYCGDIKPSYITPIDKPLSFSKSEYSGFTLN